MGIAAEERGVPVPKTFSLVSDGATVAYVRLSGVEPEYIVFDSGLYKWHEQANRYVRQNGTVLALSGVIPTYSAF